MSRLQELGGFRLCKGETDTSSMLSMGQVTDRIIARRRDFARGTLIEHRGRLLEVIELHIAPTTGKPIWLSVDDCARPVDHDRRPESLALHALVEHGWTVIRRPLSVQDLLDAA